MIELETGETIFAYTRYLERSPFFAAHQSFLHQSRSAASVAHQDIPRIKLVVPFPAEVRFVLRTIYQGPMYDSVKSDPVGFTLRNFVPVMENAQFFQENLQVLVSRNLITSGSMTQQTLGMLLKSIDGAECILKIILQWASDLSSSEMNDKRGLTDFVKAQVDLSQVIVTIRITRITECLAPDILALPAIFFRTPIAVTTPWTRTLLVVRLLARFRENVTAPFARPCAAVIGTNRAATVPALGHFFGAFAAAYELVTVGTLEVLESVASGTDTEGLVEDHHDNLWGDAERLQDFGEKADGQTAAVVAVLGVLLRGKAASEPVALDTRQCCSLYPGSVVYDSEGRVVQLNLACTGTIQPWTGSFFPQQLQILSDLRKLSLQDCAMIGSLPDIWSSFPHLETLNLQGNNLDGPLPPTFDKLNHLRSLTLAQNSLLVGEFPSLLRDHISLNLECDALDPCVFDLSETNLTSYPLSNPFNHVFVIPTSHPPSANPLQIIRANRNRRDNSTGSTPPANDAYTVIYILVGIVLLITAGIGAGCYFCYQRRKESRALQNGGVKIGMKDVNHGRRYSSDEELYRDGDSGESVYRESVYGDDEDKNAYPRESVFSEHTVMVVDGRIDSYYEGEEASVVGRDSSVISEDDDVAPQTFRYDWGEKGRIETKTRRVRRRCEV
ncbi:hypothetical protein HDU98_003935 [Podochytrium sp. JEL0797]|nr:hypothetical protein HDU98_003935 [Podochytrium sp. JEL0797]